MTLTGAPKKTSLHANHLRLGARMVDFGGWEMPVFYSGIIEEHLAVRRAAGLFDVSHMGEIEIRGPEAFQLTDHVTSNAVSRLSLGQAQYSALLYPHGGFVDDILVHKVAEDHYFLCVNAANQEKDFEHIRQANRWQAEVEFAGPRYAQLAVQGPLALATLQPLTPLELSEIRYYHFLDGDVDGVQARVARTGYTGEDGFEVYLPAAEAPALWDKLLEAGSSHGIRPCGLGARNTLRLEAAMALYGHEIDASITPLEAGLGWIAKLDKGDFIGREALLRQKERGVTRKLTGIQMRGREIARDGYEVYLDGQAAGWVTSGGPAPALNKNIGLCYLPAEKAEPGTAVEVMIRGRLAEAQTVPIPFYKRAK